MEADVSKKPDHLVLLSNQTFISLASWQIFHRRFRVLLELGQFQKMAIPLVALLLERLLCVIEYALFGLGSEMPVINEALDFARHADT